MGMQRKRCVLKVKADYRNIKWNLVEFATFVGVLYNRNDEAWLTPVGLFRSPTTSSSSEAGSLLVRKRVERSPTSLSKNDHGDVISLGG